MTEPLDCILRSYNKQYNIDATKESEQFHISIQGLLYSYDWLSHKLSLSSFTVDLLSGVSDDCQRNCSSLGEFSNECAYDCQQTLENHVSLSL